MKKTILRQLIVTIGGLITLLSAGNLLAAAGDLYVANSNGGNILKVNSGLNTVFASGLTVPFSVAFDGSGNLFVAEQSAGTIIKITPNGTKTTFASGLGCFSPSPSTLRAICLRWTRPAAQSLNSRQPVSKAPLHPE